MKTYPNLEAFYDENPVRRHSGEADFGVWWTEAGQKWPQWRVSYLHATGEVYAMEQKSGGRVQVLGVVPPDNEILYYRTLNQILEGWPEAMREGLEWVRQRLKGV